MTITYIAHPHPLINDWYQEFPDLVWIITAVSCSFFSSNTTVATPPLPRDLLALFFSRDISFDSFFLTFISFHLIHPGLGRRDDWHCRLIFVHTFNVHSWPPNCVYIWSMMNHCIPTNSFILWVNLPFLETIKDIVCRRVFKTLFEPASRRLNCKSALESNSSKMSLSPPVHNYIPPPFAFCGVTWHRTPSGAPSSQP